LSWAARALLSHPHGALFAVDVAGAPPEEALARLLPEEQAFAAGLAPLRQASWVAGRLALAAALDAVGAARAPLLATARGAPRVAAGFVGSVSHKPAIAVALAARDEGAAIGVDVEQARPGAIDVSRKVLTAHELAVVDALPADERWRGVLVRFSIKEAIYKAVDPFVQRYVGFKEAEVEIGRQDEGIQRAEARLDVAEGPFAVEATWVEIEGHVVSSARAFPMSARPASG
jgi:4'-phosphopantetheinyl transferase EntD